ncbi:hypothetical protein ACPPVU_12550 [Mucilaginibacter sp. McL0603]|uniref:hypothetical protein n=1 Tax=Mucilaginibacter sp. McL0603 TaxID=3415670 RepID=UPI003CEF7816
MNEAFIIPLVYQGTEREFKARFERWENTHRIAVLIDEMTVNFEPVEEGAYRALISPESVISTRTPDVNLLRAVAEKLACLSN